MDAARPVLRRAASRYRSRRDLNPSEEEEEAFDPRDRPDIADDAPEATVDRVLPESPSPPPAVPRWAAAGPQPAIFRLRLPPPTLPLLFPGPDGVVEEEDEDGGGGDEDGDGREGDRALAVSADGRATSLRAAWRATASSAHSSSPSVEGKSLMVSGLFAAEESVSFDLSQSALSVTFSTCGLLLCPCLRSNARASALEHLPRGERCFKEMLTFLSASSP
mmetsp:Transcript_29192/g.86421  ORF Transcript_29192/g.86421 Transcript_29192/m.86421 type:complete len:220 (-) Transcript_29192:265-924(-)